MKIYNVNRIHNYRVIYVVFVILNFCNTLNALSCQNDTIIDKPTSVESDSIKKWELDEIIITAERAFAINDGVSFLPSKKEIKHSTDAFSLLQNMALPMLKYSPGKIETTDGYTISYFINSIPASEIECKNLIPTDVIRVEYLKNPTQPEYSGVNTIINFVTRKRIYGGYFRLTPEQKIIPNSGSYMLYSKYNYRHMTYDLSLSYDYDKYKNTGLESTTIYRNLQIPQLSSSPNTLTRIQTLRGNEHHNSFDVRFRTLYNKEKTNFYNTVVFTSDKSINPSSGLIRFSPEIISSDKALSQNNYSKKHFTWIGFYSFALKQGCKLIIAPSFNYVYGTTLTSLKHESYNDIKTENTEKSYHPNLSIFYSHRFDKNNITNITLKSRNSIFNTDYAGSSSTTVSTQEITNSLSDLNINYINTSLKNTNINIGVGMSFLFNSVSHRFYLRKWHPSAQISLNNRFSDKDFISIGTRYFIQSPSAYYTTDITQQINEIEWFRGNPYLLYSQNVNASVSYTHIFSQAISGNIALQYVGNFKSTTPYWMPEDNKMINTFFSNGTCNQIILNLSAPIRLCDNSISINPSLSLSKIHKYGGIDYQRFIFGGSIMASYQWKNWQVSTHYLARQRGVATDIVYRLPSQYGISLQYLKNNFSIKVGLNNIFRKLKADVFYIHTENYSKIEQYFRQGSFTRQLLVSATYTINFGRKIANNNEIDVIISNPTSVMPSKR